MNFELMIDKKDFSVVGYNEYVVTTKKTHIGITRPQYDFVRINPSVNGPKLLLFILTSEGMADDIKNSAFMEILRKEQKAQDAGAPAYVPPVVAQTGTGNLPPPTMVGDSAPVAPPVTGAAETLRAALDQLPDAEAVKAYAEKLLGKPLEVHPKAGKYKCIMATIAAMSALSSATT